MDQFIVTGACFRVNRGTVLNLDEKQYKRRKHIVKEIKKGVYEALEPFEFKRGEKVSIETADVKKKQLEEITEKSLYEKLEEERKAAMPIDERIKRMTKAQLEEFYFLNCNGSEFQESEDLTNKVRKEMIIDWFENNKV